MRLKSANVTTFQENIVPSGTKLAGLAALARALAIQAPVRRPSCISEKHIRGSRRQEDAWTVFDRRYWPGDTFADHLTFALRHEDIDLLILKRVFEAVSPNTMAAFVRAAPSGNTTRRAWFLYEAFTDRTLRVSDAPEAAALDLLDPKAYFTGKPRLSKRHRVRDNLLGTGRFCPVIRRTTALADLVARDVAKEAAQTIGRTGAHLVARAASFMLLADSRASFEKVSCICNPISQDSDWTPERGLLCSTAASPWADQGISGRPRSATQVSVRTVAEAAHARARIRQGGAAWQAAMAESEAVRGHRCEQSEARCGAGSARGVAARGQRPAEGDPEFPSRQAHARKPMRSRSIWVFGSRTAHR